MEPKQKALELKVGFFLFIGFAVIAGMIAKFGQIGQGFSDFYDLTVHFANAGGLIRNSDVQLAGARIGYVDTTPDVRTSMAGVEVKLKIQSKYKIPKKTHFQVGSSGLLGDRFVEVVPDPDFDPAKFNPSDPSQTWKEGSVIEGTQQMGLAELQNRGVAVLDALKARADELQVTINKINTGILTDENAGNLKVTFENLRKTSESFAEASGKLKGVMENADKAVVNANGVIDSAKKTMGTVDNAAADIHQAVDDGRKLIAGAKGLIDQASQGRGVVGMLLSDRQSAENLRAFISNLRQRGVLFYRDTAPRQTPQLPVSRPSR